jgi:uncharacterized protein YkwD
MPRLRPLRDIGALALCGAALAAGASPATAAGCAHQDARPTTANVDEIRSATLCLVNRERAERDRSRLRSNGHLEHAAQRHSSDMVRRAYFGHVSPGGGTLVDRVKDSTFYLRGARSWGLGENLAWGSGTRATPRQTVAAWMRSPGHRKNILTGSFRELGVGVSLGSPRGGGRSAATYATNFGRRG